MGIKINFIKEVVNFKIIIRGIISLMIIIGCDYNFGFYLLFQIELVYYFHAINFN